MRVNKLFQLPRIVALAAMLALTFVSMGTASTYAATGASEGQVIDGPSTTIVSNNADPRSGPVVLFIQGVETVAVCTSTPRNLLLVQPSSITPSHLKSSEISVPQLCGGLWEHPSPSMGWMDPRDQVVTVLMPDGTAVITRCTSEPHMLFAAAWDEQYSHIQFREMQQGAGGACDAAPATTAP